MPHRGLRCTCQRVCRPFQGLWPTHNARESWSTHRALSSGQISHLGTQNCDQFVSDSTVVLCLTPMERPSRRILSNTTVAAPEASSRSISSTIPTTNDNSIHSSSARAGNTGFQHPVPSRGSSRPPFSRLSSSSHGPTPLKNSLLLKLPFCEKQKI